MSKNPYRLWKALSIVLILLFGLSMFLGSVHIPVSAVMSSAGLTDIDLSWFFGLFHIPISPASGSVPLTDIQKFILIESRLPRSLAALGGGAGLALSGLLMQTLFRNPLAGPSVLGITSGAALAVAILTLGISTAAIAQYQIVIAAILGSLAVLLVILAVAKKFFDVTSVLIVGLMLSFFTSAIVSALQSFASANSIKSYVFWGFGSFAKIALGEMYLFLIPVLIILILSFFFIKPLNALLLGEMHAASMGIKVKSLRIQIMLATGILTGVITAFCGPVAFIGLASPHIARFIFKSVNHRIVLPSTILLGGVLALACDIISRLPGSDYALPLNTVCAFMGAPVVIYLIISGRKKKFLL